MIVAGNQSYFFPFLGYFQLINAVDKFTLYDNLDFSENRWIHHNRILLNNGNIFTISVPLVKRTSSMLIRDLKILDAEGNRNWRARICKTIYDNYRKAPMFGKVYPLIESLIKYPVQSLSALNSHAVKVICRYLEINTFIETDPSVYAEIELRISNDGYLNSAFPGLAKRDARLIEICRFEGADTLYNSMGGMELYSKEDFQRYGIRVMFLQRKDFVYKQFGNPFIPDLSIIDVMMFNDVPAIYGMLGAFELI